MFSGICVSNGENYEGQAAGPLARMMALPLQ
jgi:hypothetical protein